VVGLETWRGLARVPTLNSEAARDPLGVLVVGEMFLSIPNSRGVVMCVASDDLVGCRAPGKHVADARWVVDGEAVKLWICSVRGIASDWRRRTVRGGLNWR